MSFRYCMMMSVVVLGVWAVNAAPVSREELEIAVAAWSKNNPALGADQTVASITCGVHVARVTYAPRGFAAFSLDTDQIPVRFFTPDGTADTLAADVAYPHDARAAATWARLLNRPRKLSLAAVGSSVTNECVGPLLRTRWGQYRHFNRFTPRHGSDRIDDRQVTGCVATGIAQVLAHNRWPRRPVIKPNLYAGEQVTLKRPYEFENMLDLYPLTVPATNVVAVAQLMLDIGNIVNMGYYSGVDTSGANSDSEAPDAYKYVFRYPTAQIDSASPLASTTFDQVKQNIMDGFVAHVCGPTTENHCYVCDGYMKIDDQDYFHFNYGWNGASDNWVPRGYGYITSEGEMFPIRSIIYNIIPSREPVMEPTPQVISPSDTTASLAWTIADCHTNALQSIRLVTEKQVSVADTTSIEIPLSQWKGTNDVFGVTLESGKIVESTYVFWNSVYMPAATVSSPEIALSGAEMVTIVYSYTRRDPKMDFYLVPGSYTETGFFEYKENNNRPVVLHKLQNTTEDRWFTATQTVSLVEWQSTPRFAIGLIPWNNDFDSVSVPPAGTRLLTLDRVTIENIGGGSVNVWEVQGTNTLAKTTRQVVIPGHDDDTRYRYTVLADYGGTNRVAAADLPVVDVSATETSPRVSVAETHDTVVFTVACDHAWTYTYTQQQGQLNADTRMPYRLTRNGNVITVRFTEGIAALGSYWVNLHVVDSVTGYTTDAYHILNLPPDFPVSHLAYTEADALAKARATGLPIFFATPYADSTERPSTTSYAKLLTNTVLRAMLAENYIYWESNTAISQKRMEATKYNGSDVFNELYGMVINTNAASETVVSKKTYTMKSMTPAQLFAFLMEMTLDDQNGVVTDANDLAYIKQRVAQANVMAETALPSRIVLNGMAHRGTTAQKTLSATEVAHAARLLNLTPKFEREGDQTVATVDYGFRCSSFTANAGGLSVSVALDAADKDTGEINGTLTMQQKVQGSDTWADIPDIQQPQPVFEKKDGQWCYTFPFVVPVSNENKMYRAVIQ